MIAFDIKPSPVSTFETDIEGSTYRIKLVWSYKYSDWHMYISAADGTPLLSGIKLVPDSNLTGTNSVDGLFSGHLEVLRLSTESKIGFRSFQNNEFKLIYISEDEDFSPIVVITDDYKVTQLGEDVNEISNLPIYDSNYVSPIPDEAKEGNDNVNQKDKDCLPIGIYTIGSCEPFDEDD
jgi:hypothetical protein